MNAEKQLKKMLAPGGALDQLKDQVADLCHPQDKNSLSHLVKLLTVVSYFQNDHHKKMNAIKSFYTEKTYPKEFVLITVLYAAIKRCGIDKEKDEFTASFVHNSYSFRRNRFMLRPKLGLEHVLLSTELTHAKVSINWLENLPQKGSLDFIEKAIIKTTRWECKTFVSNNASKIYNYTESIQEHFKSISIKK